MKTPAIVAAAAGMSLLGSAAGAQPATDGWMRLMDQLRPLSEEIAQKLPDAKDPQLRAELDQMLLGVLMHGYLDIVASDPEQPQFMPGYGLAMNYAAPNGDTVYLHTRIDGNGVYRLSGRRGTAPVVNFGVGDQWYQLAGVMTPRTDYNIDSLPRRPDGTFSVILSAERPAGYTGDWWQMPRSTTYVGLRQVLNDWENEVDAQIAIERLDRPVNRGRRPAAELEAQIALLPDWVKFGAGAFLDHVKKLRERPVNTVQSFEVSGGGGLPGQSYYDGIFDIAPDEALILEVRPPKQCLYWSVLVTDELFATIDWMNHQSSINGHQAHVDSDGVFRAVLALKDPGVPNWLDPGDRRRGAVQGRWLGCEEKPFPTLTKVKAADVRAHLPKDTPVVTAAMRDETLRARKRAFQKRRWW